MVSTVRMRFADRRTFRRWFPVWVGLVKWTGFFDRRRNYVTGFYVRVLSRIVMVQVRDRHR